MAHLSNCVNCLFATTACVRRDGLRAGLKGLSVTSVKFICRDRRPMFAVGQRVSVGWPVPSEDDVNWRGMTVESWPATVVAERGKRFQIVVDDVDSDHETPAREYIKNESLYAKVPAWRLTALDEPAKSVCEVCQQVANNGEVRGCFTETSDPSNRYDYLPANCLARIIASVGTHPEGRDGEAGSVRSMGDAVRKAQTPNLPPNPPHPQTKERDCDR